MSKKLFPIIFEGLTLNHIPETETKPRKRRLNPDIKSRIIEEVYSKALQLNYNINSKRGPRTKGLLNKQYKKIEKFSNRNMIKLAQLPFFMSIEENNLSKMYKTQLFIMKMRYNALNRLFEKLSISN